ncbi:MAG: hypothetical protein RL513_1784, partial [Pseudomonadota bacterium]
HRQDFGKQERLRVMATRHTPATWGHSVYVRYMSMVLRIRPTARPSISKGSPGSTTMVG